MLEGLGEAGRQEGDDRMRCLDGASPTQWTEVWVELRDKMDRRLMQLAVTSGRKELAND